MKHRLMALLLAASMAFSMPASVLADDFTLIEEDDFAEELFEEESFLTEFEDETLAEAFFEELPAESESETEIEIDIETEDEEETDEFDEGMTLEGASVNPIYEGIITEEDLLPVETASEDGLLFEANFVTSNSEIAHNLKNVLLNRTTTTTIYYGGNIDWSQDGIDAKIEDWLYTRACAHTGVANEGDYLQWNILGYSWKASRSGEKIGGYYQNTFQVTFTYAANTTQENAATVETTRVLNSFGFNSGMTDYEKIRTIYDWMTATISYDHAGLAADSNLCHSAYAAVCKHSSVCQGYALQFYRMCLASGIDSRIVAGDGAGDNHGWNIVRLSGKYYYVDATWDTDDSPYNYFLTGSNRFNRNHVYQAYLNPTFRPSDYAISAEDYSGYWNDNRNYKYIYYNACGGKDAPATQKMNLYTSDTLSSTIPWRKITVQFNANGGSCSTAEKKVSFTFKNWNTRENGSGTAYAPGSYYTSRLNTTLYAQWQTGTLSTMPTASRTGYTLQGWYTSKTGGTKYTGTTAIKDNMTLYAQWKANSYTVTFDVNGGKGGPGTKTVTYGTNLGSLTAPTLDYSTFKGWYTEKTGGNKVTTYNLTKNTTLYARYERTGIQSFVYRLYTTCLDRKPELSGFEYWCNKLKTKAVTGKSCAHGFVFSVEFNRRYPRNVDFIEQLYSAMLGRASDASGKAYWLNKMQNGATRESIFNSFANSPEFNRICSSYGITPK